MWCSHLIHIGVSAPNIISDIQVQQEKPAISQQHLTPEASDVRISSTVPDVKDTYLPQANPSEALTGSLFRNTLAKFYTSIKHMSTPSLLLVVTIAVILVLMQVNLLTGYIIAIHLMHVSIKHKSKCPYFCTCQILIYLFVSFGQQISILVLLSRPQRIHVISQAGGCMNGNENRGEALASVNRQVKYLKEEMHFVETLLEKMQYEHSQLKGKLRELEVFRNQWFWQD